MRICDYCGRESEASAAACAECGTGFVIHVRPETPLPPLLPASVVQVLRLLRRNEFRIKRILWFLAGSCWFAGSLAFLLFLAEYLAEGAGLQLFGWAIWSGGVLLGLVHVLGLLVASGLCFVIAVGLCAHAVVGKGTWHYRDSANGNSSGNC
jgi:hypothetical protein